MHIHHFSKRSMEITLLRKTRTSGRVCQTEDKDNYTEKINDPCRDNTGEKGKTTIKVDQGPVGGMPETIQKVEKIGG